MQWNHRVNPEWLTARKNFLSASDVKKLIPVTATGRPRANLEEAYLKVWAEKQSRVTEDDVCSSGVMARGHLLEPYAIEAFNKMGVFPTLFHWDDTLIYSKDGMSYSPDALSVQQPTKCPVSLASTDAYFLGEVKAYNAATHYAVGLGGMKGGLEERWQIATAFYVSDELEAAALILFNPNTKHPLLWHRYDRDDLLDEIDMIEQVCTDYADWEAIYSKQADGECPATTAGYCQTEEEIITVMLEEQDINAGLNP